jgi:hypothetical protein
MTQKTTRNVTRSSDSLRPLLERILARPTPAGLWGFQKRLLAIGDDAATARARAVVRAFHGCLRTLESKSASRTASRWGAVLGTAAVGSVSLPELRDRHERGLHGLVDHALPALLEVGAALQSAQAWEIEAGLIYDEFAWFLDEELWDVSLAARPDIAAAERRERIDAVLDPLLDASVPDSERAALLVDVFRSVLAARVLPLLSEGPKRQ